MSCLIIIYHTSSLHYNFIIVLYRTCTLFFISISFARSVLVIFVCFFFMLSHSFTLRLVPSRRRCVSLCLILWHSCCVHHLRLARTSVWHPRYRRCLDSPSYVWLRYHAITCRESKGLQINWLLHSKCVTLVEGECGRLFC